MKQFRFPVGLIAMLAICVVSVAGQTTNVPVAQNRVGAATNGGGQASNARPHGRISQNAGRGAVGANARIGQLLSAQTVAQRSVNSRPNYSAATRALNPTLAAMNARQIARTYNVQPVPDVLARNDVTQSTLLAANSQRIDRSYSLQPTRNIRAGEDLTQRGLATPNVRRGGKVVRPTSDKLPLGETSQDKSRHNGQNNKHHRSFSDAFSRHRHEWHDRNWWKQNCETIVFVNSGYYFLDAGYWYPAWGYDPVYSYYDYDGPIYTYGDLLPDQVIANVQEALQEAGYYFGPITGSLSVETRVALANFQRDYGLPITGAIDQPTVETLGLY